MLRINLANVSGGTATANGTAVRLPAQVRSLRLSAESTNNSGTTPTLDITLETSVDKQNWTEIGGLTQFTTSTGYDSISITDVNTVFQTYIRAVGTLAGTSPNYDYRIDVDCER